jgi:hypothetical protein
MRRDGRLIANLMLLLAAIAMDCCQPTKLPEQEPDQCNIGKDREDCEPEKRNARKCVMEEGIDYPGGVCNEKICTGSDLEYIKDVKTARRCCKKCYRHPECVYWTHAGVNRHPAWQRLGCWLKRIDAGSTRCKPPFNSQKAAESALF